MYSEKEKGLIIENIIKRNETVHCQTEDEAMRVLSIANKLGLTWVDGDEYGEKTYWNYYKNKTAYSLVDGYVDTLDYFPEENDNIIKAKEFIERYEKFKDKIGMEYSNKIKLLGNEIVHCNTEDEANLVLGVAHELGYKWCTGSSFKGKNNYMRFGCKTCYWITAGEYCDIDYYKEIGKTIISAEEFLSRHNIISKKRDIYKELQELINNDPEKESILQEAERIVNGDRQADYSDPVENFKRIATIASVLIGKEITAKDCCKVMMAVKLAREANKHKRDNLVDLCGYNHILNLIEES